MILQVTAKESDEVAELEGIPAETWELFKANAKKQFPQDGDLAWAAYLSEVIVSGGGGDEGSVSYFMTKVPKQYALAVQRLLAQVHLTWDQFHIQFIRAVVASPHNVRLTNFTGTEHNGMYIAMGLDPSLYAKAEANTPGHTFEQLMATIFTSAAAGGLTFGEGTQFVEPVIRE